MPLHKLELLAPVGKMDVLPSVVEAGADAVYLGGKRFNMRALKDDFNFTEKEIALAAEYLHQKDRKLYITLNNLYNGNEMDDIADYLIFLQGLGVDAFIVQDLGIIDLYKQLGLNIPLHASVQMGITNLEAVRVLEEQGFSRVILSRNVTLSETKEIAHHTSMGIEFFIHGELCVSHAGQCYISSLAAGKSSNRGLCRKPCRWLWELQGDKDDQYSGYQYLLAYKDLCLYPYIPELISAGVSSFKIEGRMRSAEYLAWLVSIYRRAIDRYLLHPDQYKLGEQDWHELKEKRIRDYTSGSLIEPPTKEVVGFDGLREPPFPTACEAIIPLTLADITEPAAKDIHNLPEISVKVGGIDSLKSVCHLDIDHIILGCEIIRQNKQNWSWPEIEQAAEVVKNRSGKLFLELPRIVSQNELTEIRLIKERAVSMSISGVIVNDLGSLNIFKESGLEIWTGYGLNVMNHHAAEFLQGLGVNRITASLEMNNAELQKLLASGTPAELLVQGPLPGMISDFCIIKAAQADQEGCSLYCTQDEYALIDNCRQKYIVRTDSKCRNYLFFPYDLCLLASLPKFSQWGLKSIRIDGQYYNSEKLLEIVTIYKQSLEQIAGGQWDNRNYALMMQLFPQGLTAAMFANNLNT